MRAITRLVVSSFQLSYRAKIAFFFNFIFPLLMAFAYFQIFARGAPEAVARMMGPLVSLTIMINALLIAGMRSAEMRERDMFRQFHLTPVTAFHVVMSDMLLGYLLFLPVLAAELLLGLYGYHMPFAGSISEFFLMCSVGYLTLSALGVLLSSLVNTVQEANVVIQLVFFVLLFLSGTTMPLEDLPRSLQRIATFTPPTLMIVPLNGILLRGDTLLQHAPEIAALLATCVAAGIVAVLVFRWDKYEKVPRRNRIQAIVTLIPLLIVGMVLNSSSHQSWLPAATSPAHTTIPQSR